MSLLKRRAKAISPVIVNFADIYDGEELLALTYRLQAFKNMVRESHGSTWVIEVKDKRYKLVNEAMFGAAAKAPLAIEATGLCKDVAFDADDFLSCALAESPAIGSA